MTRPASMPSAANWNNATGFAALLFVLGAAYLGYRFGWRKASVLAVGGGFGFALYHAAFGFTRAWREFIADRRGQGLRVQMLLFAITVCLFFPALAAGELFGRPVGGFVVPASMMLAIGAFVFGVGMQIAGGCASGTLFAVGGGNTRMVVALAGFIAGSVIATAHLHIWSTLPKLPPISLVKSWGLTPALLFNLAIFGAIALIAWWLERRRYGATSVSSDQSGPQASFAHRLMRGPWPLTWGAVALAGLSFATLALAGRPWGITSAFALWGAKIALLLGIDVTTWPYWAARQGALDKSVLADTTSVMNFGIVLGALLAAGLACKFAPTWRIKPRLLLSAIIGGLMLGYGARLASGCNIGAYFSGIVSGSLHGWLWLLAGFAGSVIGTRLRPLAGFARA